MTETTTATTISSIQQVAEWQLGKLVQKSAPQFLDAFLHQRNTFATSLSQKVLAILLLQEHDKKQAQVLQVDTYVNDCKLLRLADAFTMSHLLQQAQPDANEDDMFIASANYLRPICYAIHEYMVPHLPALASTHKEYLALLGQKHLFAWFVDEHVKGNSLFAFTLAVSFLEQGLQDAVCAHYVKQGNQKALLDFNEKLPKINDLFVMPEMKEIFGNDVMFLIRSFMGPLNSLNLRNVTLHGFVAPQEFADCYTTFLLLLICSLHDKVKDLLAKDSDYRPVLKMDKDIGYGNVCTLNFADMVQNNEIDPLLLNLFENSFFVMKPWLPLWKSAIRESAQGRIYHALMYIFPILEHCIRRVFVCVNECADRLLTAEKDSLYTTLDILLSTIPSSHMKDKQNGIFDELGAPIVNALFDMLIWTDSPRVRDLLSHGNIEPSSIHPIVLEKTWIVIFCLLVNYDVRNNYSKAYMDSLPAYVTHALHNLSVHYEPAFHPRNQLYRSIVDANLELEKVEQFMSSQAIEGTFPHKPELVAALTECHQYLESHPSVLNAVKNGFSSLCDFKSIFSVVIPVKELRKVSQLSTTVSQIKIILVELVSSIQIIKELIAKRKAKDNHKTLLPYLQAHADIFFLLVKICLWCAFLESQNAEDTDTDFIAMINKMLASVASGAKTNKWLRAMDTIVAFMLDDSIHKCDLKNLSKKEVQRYYANLLVQIKQKFVL